MINSFRGEYRWLSNFWFATIVVDGFPYWNLPHQFRFRSLTNEHAYQAMKAATYVDFLWILDKPLPVDAKRGGKEITLREDWEAIKLDVMYDINRAKYTQHRDLRAKLLATGDQELIEGNTWFDTYWGVCNGVGENNLGKILMRVREELK